MGEEEIPFRTQLYQEGTVLQGHHARRTLPGWQWRNGNRANGRIRLGVSTIGKTPEALSHKEGTHGLRPDAIVLSVKDLDKCCKLGRHCFL
jgi:hypothetical protein